MKISDELRKEAAAVKDYRVTFASKRILKLADRIDAEMVELPRGNDGKPIRVGETVYGKDGKAWRVRGVTIGEMSEALRYTISVTSDTDGWRHIRSEWFTHERPDSSDSLERIAQDMEDWSDDNRVNWISDVSDRAAEFAHRIRKLAKKEGER